MVRISVIVPIYNGSAFVKQCVLGVLNQDYPRESFELILVDNNSVDGSADLVRDFDRVSLIRETEQGAYSARNAGVRIAQGEIIAFTDADCVPGPGWLSAIDRGMRDSGAGVMIGPRFYPARGMQSLASYENARVEYILDCGDCRKYFGFTNNMAVGKSTWDAHGPFQKISRGADTLFVQRVAVAEGDRAVRWNKDMTVTHLEMQLPLDYLRKSFLYARARSRARQAGSWKTLGPRECDSVFRRVARGQSFVANATLLFWLGAGRILWTLGSLL